MHCLPLTVSRSRRHGAVRVGVSLVPSNVNINVSATVPSRLSGILSFLHPCFRTPVPTIALIKYRRVLNGVHSVVGLPPPRIYSEGHNGAFRGVKVSLAQHISRR